MYARTAMAVMLKRLQVVNMLNDSEMTIEALQAEVR